MIKTKLIVIIFAIVISVSVASLIIYDQWIQVQNEMAIPTVTPQLDFTDEEEKQRKIDSLIPPEPSYGDPAIAEYWDRAKLDTLPTENNIAFDACVDSILGKYFTPQTAEESYKLTKAMKNCDYLRP